MLLGEREKLNFSSARFAAVLVVFLLSRCLAFVLVRTRVKSLGLMDERETQRYRQTYDIFVWDHLLYSASIFVVLGLVLFVLPSGVSAYMESLVVAAGSTIVGEEIPNLSTAQCFRRNGFAHIQYHKKGDNMYSITIVDKFGCPTWSLPG